MKQHQAVGVQVGAPGGKVFGRLIPSQKSTAHQLFLPKGARSNLQSMFRHWFLMLILHRAEVFKLQYLLLLTLLGFQLVSFVSACSWPQTLRC